MAFVNEPVPEADVVKYGLEAINKRYLKGTSEYYWTIDRDRDIHLRWMGYIPEEMSVTDFSFYWKGALLSIRLKRSGDGQRGGKGSTTWTPIDSQLLLPAKLEAHRSEIIVDLKDALRAFKDFGVFSTIADHTAYFEF